MIVMRNAAILTEWLKTCPLLTRWFSATIVSGTAICNHHKQTKDIQWDYLHIYNNIILFSSIKTVIIPLLPIIFPNFFLLPEELETRDYLRKPASSPTPWWFLLNSGSAAVPTGTPAGTRLAARAPGIPELPWSLPGHPPPSPAAQISRVSKWRNE